MIDSLRAFFGIVGLDITPPSNMAELFPYLFTVLLGFGLISAIFGMFRSIIMALISRNNRLG